MILQKYSLTVFKLQNECTYFPDARYIIKKGWMLLQALQTK